MSAYTLISGVMTKPAEQRLSKNGNSFVMANVRVKDGDAHVYWRIFAFNEAVTSELLRLSEGDAVSLTGAMKAEIYAPEGKPARVSFSLTAEAAVGLKPKPREKSSKFKQGGALQPHPSILVGKPQIATDPDLNDTLSF